MDGITLPDSFSSIDALERILAECAEINRAASDFDDEGRRQYLDQWFRERSVQDLRNSLMAAFMARDLLNSHGHNIQIELRDRALGAGVSGLSVVEGDDN